ncbi:MAG: DUF99 family protein [Nitrososphaerota archaeon]|nr:DUF99 family protein [Nitrososphaerota archaeon]MDG6939832.1 DUF99 family protein [Nitrososphaerota archaeon]
MKAGRFEPRAVHPFKPGIRVLGVAESFDPRRDRRSVLAGVVMRRDLVVDGVGLGSARLGGYDATESIVRLYRSFGRRDINVVMLSGAVISQYNIVDVEKVASGTGRPVICLTYRESRGLEEALRRRFPDDFARKVEAYGKLGGRSELTLKTGKRLFARLVSLSEADAQRVLDGYVLQGRYPEPVRVAMMVASAARRAGGGRPGPARPLRSSAPPPARSSRQPARSNRTSP